MDMETNPKRPASRPAAVPASIRLLAAVVTLSFLGACGPIVLTTEGPRAELRVSAAAAGGVLTIRVPEQRPTEGLEVRHAGGRSFRIPAGHLPAPGECRIWRPDVPPGRQDPPGSCDELRRRVPAGAYLVEG